MIRNNDSTNSFAARSLLCCLIIFLSVVAGHQALAQDPGNILPDETREARLQWWRDARFGLFIHWGLYSIPAGEWKGETAKKDYAEWAMHNFQIPFEEYSALAKEFNPTKFNPDDWAELAANAGMGYFVLTTKHHDGFAMFDSDVSDYNIVDATPFDRDVFGELAVAFRKRNMKAGAYYSQDIDWSQPQGQTLQNYNTWDYPVDKRDNSIFDKYMVSKSLPQVKELCTNYGDVDLFWFDVPRTVDKDRGKLFHDLVRKYQPDAIINGRIAVPQGLYSDYLVPGDNGYYTSPQSFDWECCATMNESWGYTKHAKTYKSADDLIIVLIKSVSAGGNLLLNVGPKPDGTIPQDQAEILKEIAVWMKDNKEAVHGTRANPFGEFFHWGLCTVKPRHIYLHVTDWNSGSTITVPRLKNRIAKVELLGDADRKLDWKKDGNNLLITLNGDPLHSSASVIKVTCGGETLEIDPVQLAESNGEVLLETCYAKSRGQRMSVLRHSIQDGVAVADLSGGHPSEYIFWDFNIDKPGMFQIVAECLEPDLENFKKRTVYLYAESKEEIPTEISATSLRNGKLNCGEIELTAYGPARLSLRVEGGKGNPLYLKELQLKRL